MKLITKLGIALVSLGLIFSPIANAALDRKSKVSSNDSTAGFLNGKLVAGTNVSLNETNDGSNETLEIAVSATTVTLDLADDDSNESTGINELATSNDTNNIVTEPTDDKVLFDMSQNWPTADAATALSANGSNCSTGQAPEGVDASGAVENCNDFILETELDTEAELETQLTDTTNVFTNNDGALDDDDLTDNSITDLSDVNIDTPADGHILVRDQSTDTRFENVAMSGDVTISVTGVTTVADDSHNHTASNISDQNAGTDITTDLEEETHASEHLENAADEIFGEDLGTACTINQILKSDGAGGLDCAADSTGGSPSFDSITTGTNTTATMTVSTGASIAVSGSGTVTATSGDSATSFFSSGTIEHERGGLEADVNAFTGLLAISGGATSEIDAKSELEGQIADVSDFAEADGDTFTGDHDFGGAGSLEIPNTTVASLPTATLGRIAIITDGSDDSDCTTGSGSTQVTCMANGSTWEPTGDAGAGTGEWTDTGTTLHPTETGDEVVLGATSPVSSAKFSIDGDADQIQALVQGNGTQTSDVVVIEQSDGTDLLVIDNTPTDGGFIEYFGGTSIFTAAYEFNTTVAGDGVVIQVDDDGASGAKLNLIHNTDSPAVSDSVGAVTFNTKVSGANFEAASFDVLMTDVTAASEDARLRFNIRQAGSQVNVANWNSTSFNVNDNNVDYDFVAETSTNALALWVDANTDSVQIDAKRVDIPDDRTIADTGDGNPATLTLEPLSARVAITCNDTDTCDITMSETNAIDGQLVKIYNVTTNVVDMADTSGVSELTGVFAMGQYDSIMLEYVVDRWIEVSRSDN